MAEKYKLIDKDSKQLSIRKQCKILGISRSNWYYKPKAESALNLELMRLMDEHYLQYPFKGARRMYIWLTKDKGYSINEKRVNRLYYKVLGLESLLPGPHTSKRGKGEDHKIYPYLLRELEINRPNQVWATDISYIPMYEGFMYLTAYIDLYSRAVLDWSISNSMTSDWCKAGFLRAVEKCGEPEILNTDQGSQYTATLFTETILRKGTKLSMDGKGRCIDNVFIERLWRSVKYEDVYLKEYKDGWELEAGLAQYFYFYNHKRRHQSLQDETPWSWYEKNRNLIFN